MNTQTQQIEKLKESIATNPSVSQKNAAELSEIAERLNYSSIRFMVAPDKVVSEEAVIEDAIFLLKNIENPTDAVTDYVPNKLK